ncbi:MAG TPA: CHASE3 domain-containing protein [Xanthobacteraceae bacterium]|jgi:signal transduction histidine kinase/CheY-like chemotaxis protein|nr:CHASE3 domain-containing protein [Xanthobacteraceae bacterium]
MKGFERLGRDDIGFARRGIVMFAASCLLLGVAGLAVLFLSFRTVEAEGWVTHTVEVRRVARELMNTTLNAETGVRGFLLTGDRAFLDPYNSALARLSDSFKELRNLTSDNPAQQRSLDALAPKLDGILDVYKQMLALDSQGQRGQAVDHARVLAGKTLMDEIRTRLDEFSQAELNLLTQRQSVERRTRVALVILAIVALLIAVGLAAYLARLTLHYVNRLADRTVELEKETERRRESEATLVQVLKMEAVGHLTGGIAHDFNNMLTIIIGNLDTTQRRLRNGSQSADSLAASLSRPVEMAMQGARNAAELTRRLLAFARRQALAPTQVDLNRLVAAVSELLRRTVGEAIGIETVLAGGLWPTLVDANQLENVLVNLVVNARDAMPGGGRVTIETANVYLDEAYAARFGDISAGQFVMLSVSDTGSGIAPDVLQRVFEPFFTTKQGGEGSGLGLAMVHGFVKQSGGHIRLYSEIGHGTTVKIYLPRLASADATLAVPAELSPRQQTLPEARASETVLLVEDNESVREYARSVLDGLGYTVIEARNAEEALRVINGGAQVDILFTDVVLGDGLNGRELANRITAKRAGMPVLFTTGYTRNAIVHHGRLDAGVHLLDKPYTQHDLAQKIRELLDTGGNEHP